VKLFGFFRPLFVGPGFAIPVFHDDGQLRAQVNENGRIIEFAPCDIESGDVVQAETSLVHLKNSHGLEPTELAREIGDPTWYAFQLLEREFMIGNRPQLVEALSQMMLSLPLHNDPILAKEIRSFLGTTDRTPDAEGERAILKIVDLGGNRSRRARKGGAPTKSEILSVISKDTELSRAQVAAVFDSLHGVIKKSLRAHGIVTLPGLMKLKVVKRPQTRARKGVNPFTGEKVTFKAKPAHKRVSATVLKNLKKFVT
jgi:DNA-binding protein HU-beta